MSIPKHIYAVLLLATLSYPAFAGIAVNPMATRITSGDGGLAEFIVTSDSDETQFVVIGVQRVSNPGSDNEQLVSDQPDDPYAVFVTPQRIVLPPRARRAIRVAVASTAPVERVYRLSLTPVHGESDGDIPALVGGTALGTAGVSIGWQPLLYVDPAEVRPQLAWNGIERRLKNVGTIGVAVERVGHCETGGHGLCEWENVAIGLFPGQSAVINDGDASRKAMRFEYRFRGDQRAVAMFDVT